MGKVGEYSGGSVILRTGLLVCGAWFLWFFVLRGAFTGTKVIERRIEEEICESEMGDAELAKNVNRFGSEVFKPLAASNPGDNVFFSPVSIAAAMSMVRIGATPNSSAEKELDRYLPCAGSLLRKLANELEMETEDVQTKFANSLWMSENLNPSYKDQMQRLNAFTEHLPKTPEPINKWVEGQTNGLIKDLLSKIDPEMIAILVNAVYFRGSWALQFSPEATTDHPFELANGKKENCRMMSLSKNVMFRELPSGAKSVKLSYGKSREFYAVLTLPPKGKAPNPYEEDSSAKFEMRKVHVRMPRFKVQFQTSVKDTLRSIGIEAVFTQLGMLKGICTREDTFIGDVVHKAVVEVSMVQGPYRQIKTAKRALEGETYQCFVFAISQVDEYGTKAAAATAVIMMATSFDPSQPIEFLVDRPFAISIVHKSGMVLFSGAINNPEFY
mmetsp:Transcript_10413/g.43272  ORF Transcript_10413/g.43272 Transcript_10413/m.43272 type:complete len:442 (+) Transcript_10413:36-1361(+)